MTNKTQFKALTHMGIFVDSNKLGSGIYQVSKPHLYDSHETTESLIARYKSISANGLNLTVSAEFIENLKVCELVDVTITINNQP